MALKLNQSTRDGMRIIKAVGEVDLYSSPDLREIVTKGGDASQTVVVDLSDVAYMDSSGVATLVEGFRVAEDNKGKFVLLAPSPSVLKVLQLSRLDSVFDIREQV